MYRKTLKLWLIKEQTSEDGYSEEETSQTNKRLMKSWPYWQPAHLLFQIKRKGKKKKRREFHLWYFLATEEKSCENGIIGVV